LINPKNQISSLHAKTSWKNKLRMGKRETHKKKSPLWFVVGNDEAQKSQRHGSRNGFLPVRTWSRGGSAQRRVGRPLMKNQRLSP
jgi:hypothetical protein